ncbi:MAG: hypothetical protein ABW321_33005 [Polyangiales bacterium]
MLNRILEVRGRVVLGVVAVLLGAAVALIFQKAPVGANPPEPKPILVPTDTPPPILPPSTATTTTQPKPEPESTEARIIFTTIPATNASVVWGKKQLGKIGPKAPLVIVRPRDSGPLDVMVYAPGYLPVQTRAHTFAAETRIQVKLTLPDQKQTLFGYRAPLDAGAPLPPDQVFTTDETGTTPPPVLP